MKFKNYINEAIEPGQPDIPQISNTDRIIIIDVDTVKKVRKIEDIFFANNIGWRTQRTKRFEQEPDDEMIILNYEKDEGCISHGWEHGKDHSVFDTYTYNAFIKKFGDIIKEAVEPGQDFFPRQLTRDDIKVGVRVKDDNDDDNEGTIISKDENYRNGTGLFTVEFDKKMGGHDGYLNDEDAKLTVRGKNGHCWFFRMDELEGMKIIAD